jgi:hypothetical protein
MDGNRMVSVNADRNSYGGVRARLACRLAVCYAVGVQTGNCHEGCGNSRFGLGNRYMGTVC